MCPSFDVFQIDSHGGVVWMGFVDSLLAAKATIQKLMQTSPSDYLILDQSSGQRLIVQQDAVGSPIVTNSYRLQKTKTSQNLQP